ncbi:MAG: amidohydrolase [Planctomycetes bacterium]|nr:amidohydrolase [Planctomycetota bacterium]
MVKQNIDRSDSISPSFGPHPCSAAQMDCSERRNLSVQAIRRTEAVTRLAQQHQVSRKFVYQQLAKATVAIDQAFEPAEPKDQKVLFYLPITKAWIHQFVLSLILICHSSFRGVLDILDAMFDYHDMSLGTIHNIAQQAVVSARRVNDSQDLSGIRIGDHDEIYQANRPVLVGIDHRSTYCYLLAVEDSRVSRREFHRLAAVAAASMASGCTGLRGRAQSPPGRFIDAHIHAHADLYDPDESVSTSIIQWMDAHDVSHAVALGAMRGYVSDERIEKGLPHPDRLVPFCVIDPREPSGGRKIIDVLREYVDAGARGFGEYKLKLAVDAPESMRVYEVCAELGLPVLLHIDSQYSFDEIGLPRFAKVLAELPECVFIAYGPGWWASISGDVQELRSSKTPVTAGGACDRLLTKYPNLYCDLSAGSGANAISRDLDFGREFLIRHSDRIMFGTDSIFPEPKDKGHFELFGNMDLPRQIKSRILRENAHRLLKLV